MTPGVAGSTALGGCPVSGFVQVIEWRTSRIDEVGSFVDSWRKRHPQMWPEPRPGVC